ncbi:hypothetical protein PERCYII40_3596 [Pseudomonas aeruginosa]|nr:hypothetical protein PERCYII40_3596 [Pseudomonas aeruginosa]
MDSLSMVEWSALFNCLRMRFVKIGTDNEMPGRIKLSQPGRDNLPFRAGICGEIGGEVCSCHFWSPGSLVDEARHGPRFVVGRPSRRRWSVREEQ